MIVDYPLLPLTLTHNILQTTFLSKIAKGCFDIAMPYIIDRTQFGTRLADFQVSVMCITSLRRRQLFILTVEFVVHTGNGASVRTNCNGNLCGRSHDV
jgi:hypothetical protein